MANCLSESALAKLTFSFPSVIPYVISPSYVSQLSTLEHTPLPTAGRARHFSGWELRASKFRQRHSPWFWIFCRTVTPLYFYCCDPFVKPDHARSINFGPTPLTSPCSCSQFDQHHPSTTRMPWWVVPDVFSRTVYEKNFWYVVFSDVPCFHLCWVVPDVFLVQCMTSISDRYSLATLSVFIFAVTYLSTSSSPQAPPVFRVEAYQGAISPSRPPTNFRVSKLRVIWNSWGSPNVYVQFITSTCLIEPSAPFLPDLMRLASLLPDNALMAAQGNY